MKSLYLSLVALALLSSSSSFAARDCGPGMGGGCPPSPPVVPELPGGGSHFPVAPATRLAIGYFEVTSPECSQEDLQKAIEGAKADSLANAQRDFGTDRVTRVSEFMLDTRCGHSIYAPSSTEKSWIAQAFAHYSAQ